MHSVDFVIIAVYFAIVLGIGVYLKRYSNTGEDFSCGARHHRLGRRAQLHLRQSGRARTDGVGGGLPTNMESSPRTIMVGCDSRMLFLGIVMMPFYYICKTHSVPGICNCALANPPAWSGALSFICMTILMSGINMYAMAVVMKVMLRLDIHLASGSHR